MKFTVSLVTYKHRLSDIRTLVGSVLRSSCSVFYIVDNSSDAVFAEEIAALHEERIHYIPLSNPGFGAGHNAALSAASKTDSQLHIIVNPDIFFEDGVLEKIADFMQKKTDIGLLMPKTLSPDGSLQHNCKLVPSPLDLIFKRFLPNGLIQRRMHRFTMQDYDHDLILDVPYLCGCFLAMPINVWREFGAFDERFFMYPEDIDLTRRIFAKGFRTVYYPEVSVIHAHQRESYKNFRMLWIHMINMIRYFNKWGWIFDAERRQINKKVAELNSARLEKEKKVFEYGKIS
jgi:GT2 family glycosyltransferase